ncbi:MAG: hypothetical protein ACP5GN_07490 [Fervidicoccaceae archaeon]
MPFFYDANIRVEGFLWYHFRSLPTSNYYVGEIPPVIHNYGFTLALAGFIVNPETGYGSLYGVTRYEYPVELFKKYGVYSYPLMLSKPKLGEFLMSAQNEGIAAMKSRTRLAYPFFTKNVMIMPGSELSTLVISERELPRKLVVNIGAKRAGVLRVKLTQVEVDVTENQYVTRPFNVVDVEKVTNYTVLVPHEAGDIAVFGIAERSYTYTIWEGGRKRKASFPALKWKGSEDG